MEEAGASYTSHGFDIYNKPAWFAKVNPLTGKVSDPNPLSAVNAPLKCPFPR